MCYRNRDEIYFRHAEHADAVTSLMFHTLFFASQYWPFAAIHFQAAISISPRHLHDTSRRRPRPAISWLFRPYAGQLHAQKALTVFIFDAAATSSPAAMLHCLRPVCVALHAFPRVIMLRPGARTGRAIRRHTHLVRFTRPSYIADFMRESRIERRQMLAFSMLTIHAPARQQADAS